MCFYASRSHAYRVPLHQAIVAAIITTNLEAMVGCSPGDGSDSCIHSRCVATGSDHSNMLDRGIHDFQRYNLIILKVYFVHEG